MQPILKRGHNVSTLLTDLSCTTVTLPQIIEYVPFDIYEGGPKN